MRGGGGSLWGFQNLFRRREVNFESGDLRREISDNTIFYSYYNAFFAVLLTAEMVNRFCQNIAFVIHEYHGPPKEA